MHRRQFLALAASPAFVGAFGSDGREDDLERENGYPVPPDHITEIRDDRDELERYQPKLYLGHLPWSERDETRTDMRGQFGWTAESEEYDVIAHYYWTRYNTQRSVLYYLGLDWGPDEHYLDHEPTIVFRREDGTVEEVWTTGGHHYGLRIDGETGNLSEDRVNGEDTHVNLAVMRPHNHYTEAAFDAEGEFVQEFPTSVPFDSWLDVREQWYDNNRFASTSYEAIEDPFTFYDRDREHWWREDTMDAWFARNVWIPLGLTERDDLEFET
ncbi:hypothetical protein [Halobiforma nitratireducens]|uniref:Uncharacterized protein n=1 Tax=Halobiforma nitratireducens JCM 10879 TaxID=1227454 RepID=M0MHN3_9EURY|nr:hypothetical protein [Halobiforma nitratireducens]EMA45242.1 hypothetical protein C446_02512 [Halobiforma nitratireducens JCM 10879]